MATSNIILAIPAKNQTEYIDEMVAAIEAQSVLPAKVLYLFDRPAGKERVDAARKLASHPLFVPVFLSDNDDFYIGRPMMWNGETHFLTGRAREYAIKYMQEHNHSGIVFIDGDCIPEINLIADHSDVLSVDTPAVTVGKRKEQMFGWNDQRTRDDTFIDIFFDTNTKVTNEGFFVDSGVVWTCNIGMNSSAIEKLQNVNLTLYGRHEVFPSAFLGTWGGEDGFVGLECLYNGIDVIALREHSNGIRHKDHTRPEKKYDHVRFIDYLEDRREELLFLMELYGINVNKWRYVPRDKLLVNLGLVH